MFDFLPVRVTLHEAAGMLKGLQQKDLDRWHPLNNFSRPENLADMALAFGKEVKEKSKLVVIKGTYFNQHRWLFILYFHASSRIYTHV
jgi:hypothetical protein